MIVVIISSIVAALSLLGIVIAKRLSSKKFWDKHVGPLCLISLGLSVIFGLFLIPVLQVDHIQYNEIQRYELFRSDNSIVIVVNIENTDHDTFIKYKSYQAFTGFSDSTKIFEEKEKSFYGVTVYYHIVWSNPPYKIFHRD